MRKINPSEFRHPIQILRLKEGKNEENIPGTYLVKLFETKAKVLNIRGQEFILAEGNGIKLSRTFYIRYRKDFIINEEDIIVFDSIKHKVKYANDLENRHIYWEIKCEAIK